MLIDVKDIYDFFDLSSKVNINQEDSETLLATLDVLSVHTDNSLERFFKALKLFS